MASLWPTPGSLVSGYWAEDGALGTVIGVGFQALQCYQGYCGHHADLPELSTAKALSSRHALSSTLRSPFQTLELGKKSKTEFSSKCVKLLHFLTCKASLTSYGK